MGRKEKILVTGGAGFIGSHVVDLLIEQGHQVSIIDNLWKHGGGRKEYVNAEATFYENDICEADVVDWIFHKEKPNVVCHLAAQHSVTISVDRPDHDINVNLLGLINLLQSCTKYKVRKFIFSSSGATYGTARNLPVHEKTIQLPESPYGITKMASEHYLHVWKKEYGLDFVSLRYGNVYGPRQFPDGEAGVIAIFTNSLLQNKPITIYWDGEQQKDYVYVLDVALANLYSISAAVNHGEYCIATGKGTSVNTIYQTLNKLIKNSSNVVFQPKRPGDIFKTYFNCLKALQGLGWKPTVTFEEGLQRTVDYFRNKS